MAKPAATQDDIYDFLEFETDWATTDEDARNKAIEHFKDFDMSEVEAEFESALVNYFGKPEALKPGEYTPSSPQTMDETLISERAIQNIASVNFSWPEINADQAMHMTLEQMEGKTPFALPNFKFDDLSHE